MLWKQILLAVSFILFFLVHVCALWHHVLHLTTVSPLSYSHAAPNINKHWNNNKVKNAEDSECDAQFPDNKDFLAERIKTYDFRMCLCVFCNVLRNTPQLAPNFAISRNMIAQPCPPPPTRSQCVAARVFLVVFFFLVEVHAKKATWLRAPTASATSISSSSSKVVTAAGAASSSTTTRRRRTTTTTTSDPEDLELIVVNDGKGGKGAKGVKDTTGGKGRQGRQAGRQ